MKILFYQFSFPTITAAVFASPKAKTIASCRNNRCYRLASTIEVPNLPKIAIPAAVPPAHRSSFIIVGAEYLKKIFL